MVISIRLAAIAGAATVLAPVASAAATPLLSRSRRFIADILQVFIGFALNSYTLISYDGKGIVIMPRW
jgi:hypothetical protein